jgi:Archaeal holliday junction resolvase (hjc).
MTRTTYTRGREVVYMAREMLISNGYHVIRCAASKSPVDLVAWREHEYPVFLQVKRSRVHLSDPRTVVQTYRDDIDAFRTITCPHMASRYLWVWEGRRGWRFFHVLQGGICEVSDAV